MSAQPMADARLVKSIIEELEKGGLLRDLRLRAENRRRTSLADHVRSEAQRSLDRVRLRRDFKRSDYITGTDERGDYRTVTDEHGKEHRIPAPRRTLADYRKVAKALREIAFTEEQREAARQLEAVEQEPPERSNALKHYCAAEAYFLMEMFSARKPSTYPDGAFRKIAVLIYEAVSGEDRANLERACEAVLHSRRRFQHRFS
jgi:hypothetical protein